MSWRKTRTVGTTCASKGHRWNLTAGSIALNWGVWRCKRCAARTEGYLV